MSNDWDPCGQQHYYRPPSHWLPLGVLILVGLILWAASLVGEHYGL